MSPITRCKIYLFTTKSNYWSYKILACCIGNKRVQFILGEDKVDHNRRAVV